MIHKLFLNILIIVSIGVFSYGNTTIKIDKANIKITNTLRLIDTKKEYGKSCEEYHYISSAQRLKLLKNNFPLADFISDSYSVASVATDDLVETNLTDCNIRDSHVSEYMYKEKISYLNKHIISMEIYQYSYGEGAAHGNTQISHFIYDREYGMKMNWEDLFAKSEAFDKYVLKRVVNEIADNDILDESKSYNEFLKFNRKDKLQNFRKLGYFAIVDEGLIIQYGKYEISSGAAGSPSLIIPKEILKQYMSEAMYAKCFGS